MLSDVYNSSWFLTKIHLLLTFTIVSEIDDFSIHLEIFLALLGTFFLKTCYILSIFAPNLFISSMKLGYDTSTDFESVTIQFPIYVPAIQNAMNNL